MTKSKTSKVYGWAQKFQAQRSQQSKTLDAKRKAAVTFKTDLTTNQYGKWKKHPRRYDIEGIDTPPVKRPSIEELGLRPVKGGDSEYRKKHTTNVEFVTDGDVEYPIVHLAEPIDGKKPHGKCPYCGKSSWGTPTVRLSNDGVVRYSDCLSCGKTSKFLEPARMYWTDDWGNWAVGAVPKNLVVKGDRVAQLSVYHAVGGRKDPDVYVVWQDNLLDMARSAGFPQNVYEQTHGFLIGDASDIEYERGYERYSHKPKRNEDGPKFKTDPKNTNLAKWGASFNRRAGMKSQNSKPGKSRSKKVGRR